MGKELKIGLVLAFSVFVVILIVIKLAGSKPPADKTSGQSTSSVNIISSSDRVLGNKDAKVTLVEYSDFQCPACGAYYPIVKQLNLEFAGRIQFVYRHFPLTQIHANANLAALSAEAAGKQNKFWEMHDIIFENQSKWSGEKNAKDLFVEYAQKLNLDVEKFKNDLDSDEVQEKVANDYQSGIRLGVNATPTFFLNGTKLQNPASYEAFKKLLEEAISQAQ